MPEVILSASDLVVKYSSHVVLDHASVVIHEGDRAGMVGRNGSGKSTFLRIAAGAAEPDSGLVDRCRGRYSRRTYTGCSGVTRTAGPLPTEMRRIEAEYGRRAQARTDRQAPVCVTTSSPA